MIGAKPGEKLYEELMTPEEVHRAVELPDYFAVTPAFRDVYRGITYDYEHTVSETVLNPYVSSNEPVMDKDELTSFLVNNKLLSLPSNL